MYYILVFYRVPPEFAFFYPFVYYCYMTSATPMTLSLLGHLTNASSQTCTSNSPLGSTWLFLRQIKLNKNIETCLSSKVLCQLLKPPCIQMLSKENWVKNTPIVHSHAYLTKSYCFYNNFESPGLSNSTHPLWIYPS